MSLRKQKVSNWLPNSLHTLREEPLLNVRAKTVDQVENVGPEQHGYQREYQPVVCAIPHVHEGHGIHDDQQATCYQNGKLHYFIRLHLSLN